MSTKLFCMHFDVTIQNSELIISKDELTSKTYDLAEWSGEPMIENVTNCIRDYLMTICGVNPKEITKDFLLKNNGLIETPYKHRDKEEYKNTEMTKDKQICTINRLARRYNASKDAVDKTINKNDDPVNHPSHYTDGKIEVIDFITDKNLNFQLGNAVKYICRAGKKDPNKTIEDLKKAQWYLNQWINHLEKDQ